MPLDAGARSRDGKRCMPALDCLESRRVRSGFGAVAAEPLVVHTIAEIQPPIVKDARAGDPSAVARDPSGEHDSGWPRLDPSRWKGLDGRDGSHSAQAVSSGLATSLAAERDPSLVPPPPAAPTAAADSAPNDRAEPASSTSDERLIAADENLDPPVDPSRNVQTAEASLAGGSGPGSNSGPSVPASIAINPPTSGSGSTSQAEVTGDGIWTFPWDSHWLDWTSHATMRDRRSLRLFPARGKLGVMLGSLASLDGVHLVGVESPLEADDVSLFSRFDRGALERSIDGLLDRLGGLSRDVGLEGAVGERAPRLFAILIAGVTLEAVRRRYSRNRGRAIEGSRSDAGDGSYYPGLPGLPPRWTPHEA